MLHLFRRSTGRLMVCFLALSGLTATFAPAQAVSSASRQLSRLDFSINAIGQFRGSVSGTNYQSATIEQKATNTLGGLFTVRYTKSPLLGVEFNYSFARYTERYTSSNAPPNSFQSPFNVQTRASEYTFGYVAHAPSLPLLGVRPFGAIGLGATGFYPTKFAGAGLPSRARATYYYAIGVDAPLITDRFGIRAQFRQLFFLAPDFGQNYLTINQHTTASEPAIGLYLHF